MAFFAETFLHTVLLWCNWMLKCVVSKCPLCTKGSPIWMCESGCCTGKRVGLFMCPVAGYLATSQWTESKTSTVCNSGIVLFDQHGCQWACLCNVVPKCNKNQTSRHSLSLVNASTIEIKWLGSKHLMWGINCNDPIWPLIQEMHAMAQQQQWFLIN